MRSSHRQSREVALFIMSVRMLILGVSQAGKQMVCMKHIQEFMWYALNVMEVKGKELLGLKGSVTTKLVEGEAGLSGSAPSPSLQASFCEAASSSPQAEPEQMCGVRCAAGWVSPAARAHLGLSLGHGRKVLSSACSTAAPTLTCGPHSSVGSVLQFISCWC